MVSAIVVTVLGALAAAILIGSLRMLWISIQNKSDRRSVVEWLQRHTKDEPYKSHVTTQTIVKGTGLPEKRVYQACMSDSRIYWMQGTPEQWSVWRQEPQSMYETRGLLII